MSDDLIRIGLLVERQRITEVLYSRELAKRAAQARWDALMFGYGAYIGPKPEDVVVRPYAPRLP